MPRFELGVHRSRVSGSSSNERMSSLLRQHYLLRAFNSGNNSREHFISPIIAKVFRSFLAPRDGKMLLYTVCVLGAGCILNSAVLSWLRKLNGHKSVLQGVVIFFKNIIVLFVGYFFPQMHRHLVTIPRPTKVVSCSTDLVGVASKS